MATSQRLSLPGDGNSFPKDLLNAWMTQRLSFLPSCHRFRPRAVKGLERVSGFLVI